MESDNLSLVKANATNGLNDFEQQAFINRPMYGLKLAEIMLYLSEYDTIREVVYKKLGGNNQAFIELVDHFNYNKKVANDPKNYQMGGYDLTRDINNVMDELQKIDGLSTNDKNHIGDVMHRIFIGHSSQTSSFMDKVTQKAENIVSYL